MMSSYQGSAIVLERQELVVVKMVRLHGDQSYSPRIDRT